MFNNGLKGLSLVLFGGAIGFITAQLVAPSPEPEPHQIAGFDEANATVVKSNEQDDAVQFELYIEQSIEQKVANVPLNIRQAIEAVVAKPTQFEQFAASYPLAIKATPTQLQQMIDILISMEQSNPASIGIARIFYVRYVNVNPLSALDHFWRTVSSSSSQYRRVMYSMYHEWAWIDMKAALDDIVTNTPEEVREGLISFLLSDDHYGTNTQLLEVAQNYSERTRAAALLASAQHESHSSAFERILAMPKTSDARRHGLYRLVRNWAKENPQEALEQLKVMSAGGEQQNLISTVISVWAETNPEAALEAAVNVNYGQNFGYAALSSLAKTDGARALELAQQYAQKLDPSIQNQLLQTWASSDARAAAAFVELKGGNATKLQARQIAWHYTMQYPDEAYQWAERMGLSSDHSVASNMGSALVQMDLEKAENLFAQLPSSASRSGLFTNIVRQKSKLDLADTYKWLSQYKQEPKYEEAQSNLMYEWSRRDPRAAIEVALSMEDESRQTNYLSSAASNWYDREPEAALAWVFNLPQGNTRDRIVVNLAQKLSHMNMEDALDLVSQINDDGIRERTLNYLENNARR